jgi:hypothetical protein
MLKLRRTQILRALTGTAARNLRRGAVRLSHWGKEEVRDGERE